MPGVCSRMFAGDFLEFSDEVGATESIVSFWHEETNKIY